MLNDPLANALETIKQKDSKGVKECLLHPSSKVIKKVLDILKENKYLGEYKSETESKGGILKVNLLGNINKCAAIKPKFSVKHDNYEKFEKRFLPAKGMGIIIVSTSKGVMTHNQAKKQNLGGRLLAYCY